MAKVETVVTSATTTTASAASAIASAPEAAESFVLLRPGDILLDEETGIARPDPPPASERKDLRDLADSLNRIGQIVPVIVRRDNGGRFLLVDGRRRREAALLIESTPGVAKPFPLTCVVQPQQNGADALQTAIHANIKRRGYTPIQNAYLAKELRARYGWTGTKEVADYLGVSRAWVSQHDKLLKRPAAMPVEVYNSLLAKLSAGYMGADAAFYALTHIAPEKSGETLAKAAEIAGRQGETGSKAKTSPRAGKPQRGASDKASAKAQQVPKKPDTVKIEKKHLQQAAKETKAERREKPLQRSLPDLRALYEQLRAPRFPDIMRSFISAIADQWWRGDTSDKEIVERWSQIALLVEESLERTANKNKSKSKGKK